MKFKKIQEKENINLQLRNKKKVRKLKEKGITLIALVVTIIILLILAGVTLNMALSGDGLFSRARNVADSYKKAQNDEGQLMENLTKEMDKINPKEAGTPVEVPKGEKWEEDKVTPIADGKGSAVPIPKGFYYVGGNIDTGIVISDVENDDLNNSKHGNQFVWIPCTVEEYENAVDDVMRKEWPSNNQYKDNGDTSNEIKNNGTGNGLGWHDDYNEDDNKKVKETYTTIDTENWKSNQTEVAKKSLETYNGFFVARFEAGIQESEDLNKKDGIEFEISGRGNKDETLKILNLRPVSKKGTEVWNCITQPNAKIVAENMYEGKEFGANSYLIDNVAWNIICERFEKVLKNNINGTSIIDSSLLGNYYVSKERVSKLIKSIWILHDLSQESEWKNVYYNGDNGHLESATSNKNALIEILTGQIEEFKLYNIYDMAGNAWEWTTGHYSKGENFNVILRGGAYDFGGGKSIARAHGDGVLTTSLFSIGFRVILYI